MFDDSIPTRIVSACFIDEPTLLDSANKTQSPNNARPRTRPDALMLSIVKGRVHLSWHARNA